MADPIDWDAWFDRRDEILDDIRIGHKQRDVTEALDDLYGVQYAPALAERDELKAEVERLRPESADANREVGHQMALRDQARARVTALEETVAAADADRDRLAEQVQRVRNLHREVCGGACGLNDSCECAYGECVCEECGAPYPCGTRRALDAAPTTDRP